MLFPTASLFNTGTSTFSAAGLHHDIPSALALLFPDRYLMVMSNCWRNSSQRVNHPPVSFNPRSEVRGLWSVTVSKAATYPLTSIITNGSIAGFLFLQTEHSRMARNISLGKLGIKFGPQELLLDKDYSTIDFEELKQELNDDKDTFNLFFGLVGVKSSGKTSSLKLFSKEQSNVVYISMKPGEDQVINQVYMLHAVERVSFYITKKIR